MQEIRGQTISGELEGLCSLSFLQIQHLYFHLGSKMEREKEKELFQYKLQI